MLSHDRWLWLCFFWGGRLRVPTRRCDLVVPVDWGCGVQSCTRHRWSEVPMGIFRETRLPFCLPFHHRQWKSNHGLHHSPTRWSSHEFFVENVSSWSTCLASPCPQVDCFLLSPCGGSPHMHNTRVVYTAVVPVIFSVSVFYRYQILGIGIFSQYSRCVGKISSFMVPLSKNI